MELVADLLDVDEKILWMRERDVIDFLSRKYKKLYKSIKQYYPDDNEILSHYSWKDYITNKHLIILTPNRNGYPDWYGVDISQIYEYRREFCFFNWEKLTEITKVIIEKKQRYDILIYFEILEHKIYGDDAPHHWFIKLTRSEFDQLFALLKKVAPHAKVVDGL